MLKKRFTSYLTLSSLTITLIWSTSLVSDSLAADSGNQYTPPSPSTITNNAVSAAHSASESASKDINSAQLLNALMGYNNSLITQNAAVQPPGDPPPSSDPHAPPPPYANIPKIESDVAATLARQSIDEDIFYLYGSSSIEPKELSSVPLKTGYLSKHFSAYCTPLSSEETNAYVCNNSDTSPLQHADIKPTSLLGPARYDAASGIAALEYIRSTVDPWAERNIQAAMGDTNDTVNQEKIVAALSRQSKLNAAVYAMLSAYARRLPSANNPDNKTFMETLDYEASQRYANSNWHKNIANAPTEAVLKDIAAMMATSLWMQKEQYKQNERLELLLSMNVISLMGAQDQAIIATEQGNEAAKTANENAQNATEADQQGGEQPQGPQQPEGPQQPNF